VGRGVGIVLTSRDGWGPRMPQHVMSDRFSRLLRVCSRDLRDGRSPMDVASGTLVDGRAGQVRGSSWWLTKDAGALRNAATRLGLRYPALRVRGPAGAGARLLRPPSDYWMVST